MATVNYTDLIGLALPTTGDLSGTWGTEVNDYISKYVDAAVAGTQTISGSQTAVTLSKTTGTALVSAGSGATGSSQYQIINCTGNPAGLLTITAPAASKPYIILNSTSTSQSVKIVGAGPTTGVTLISGEKAIVAWNGSDFVKVASTVITNLTGTLGVSNGGTGLTSGTSGGVLAFTASGTLASSGALAANAIVIGGGAGAAPSTTTTGTGVVTAIGNNTNAASGLAVLNSSGYLAVAQGGTNSNATPTAGGVGYGTGTAHAYTSAGTSGQVLQSNGSGAPTWANASTGTVTSVSAGTGMSFSTITSTGSVAIDTTVVPRFANAGTFTATQTFQGSSSTLGAIFNDAAEICTVSATAATGTINYDVTTQSVLYYTSNASANWTVNFRGSSGTSMNTLLSTGQCITVAFLVTQGSTAYYNNLVQVDGSTVTPKYQGGTAWSSGNASSIDVYTYTIVKTGSATFTVFASQTKFA